MVSGLEYRYDAWMAQGADGAGLVEQQLHLVAESPIQRLDRDIAPQLGVVSEVYSALAAFAQHLLDLETIDGFHTRFPLSAQRLSPQLPVYLL